MGGGEKSWIRLPNCLFRLHLTDQRRWCVKILGRERFAIPRNQGGERRRRARKKDAARSKANQESRHSKHKGARGIYAESEDPRWKNDEPKVCSRRGPLPEVKRENDRRNAPKRVSTLP